MRPIFILFFVLAATALTVDHDNAITDVTDNLELLSDTVADEIPFDDLHIRPPGPGKAAHVMADRHGSVYPESAEKVKADASEKAASEKASADKVVANADKDKAEIAKEKKEAEEAAIVSKKRTEIVAEVALIGLTAAQFSTSAQMAFRESIAANMDMPVKAVQIAELVDEKAEVVTSKEEEEEDQWLSTDLVQVGGGIGGSSLRVTFLVHPPKDIVIASEVKQLASFLKSSDDEGFSSSLQANLKKNDSAMPIPKIRVLKLPFKEALSTHMRKRTSAPTTSAPTTSSPTQQPTQTPTVHVGPIVEAMKTCGEACQHQGQVLSPAACKAYSTTPHCKACMACALPAVKSKCKSTHKEDCRLFNKAMEAAARAALSHRLAEVQAA